MQRLPVEEHLHDVAFVSLGMRESVHGVYEHRLDVSLHSASDLVGLAQRIGLSWIGSVTIISAWAAHLVATPLTSL